jgi:hypothetical protein
VAQKALNPLKQHGAPGNTSSGAQRILQKPARTPTCGRLRRRIPVCGRRLGLNVLLRLRRNRRRRAALRLLMLLAAAEETCNAGKKTATLLGSGCGCVRLRNLFFKSAYSVLCVRECVLHHERTLGKKIGSCRIFGHLAPNELISLGVPRLVTRRRESIEQTGYEVSFIGCHRERKPGSGIFTSAWFLRFQYPGESLARPHLRGGRSRDRQLGDLPLAS